MVSAAPPAHKTGPGPSAHHSGGYCPGAIKRTRGWERGQPLKSTHVWQCRAYYAELRPAFSRGRPRATYGPEETTRKLTGQHARRYHQFVIAHVHALRFCRVSTLSYEHMDGLRDARAYIIYKGFSTQETAGLVGVCQLNSDRSVWLTGCQGPRHHGAVVANGALRPV